MGRRFCLAGLPMFELHGLELGTGRSGEYLWSLTSSAEACLVSTHEGKQYASPRFGCFAFHFYFPCVLPGPFCWSQYIGCYGCKFMGHKLGQILKRETIFVEGLSPRPEGSLIPG